MGRDTSQDFCVKMCAGTYLRTFVREIDWYVPGSVGSWSCEEQHGEQHQFSAAQCPVGATSGQYPSTGTNEAPVAAAALALTPLANLGLNINSSKPQTTCQPWSEHKLK